MYSTTVSDPQGTPIFVQLTEGKPDLLQMATILSSTVPAKAPRKRRKDSGTPRTSRRPFTAPSSLNLESNSR